VPLTRVPGDAWVRLELAASTQIRGVAADFSIQEVEGPQESIAFLGPWGRGGLDLLGASELHLRRGFGRCPKPSGRRPRRRRPGGPGLGASGRSAHEVPLTRVPGGVRLEG